MKIRLLYLITGFVVVVMFGVVKIQENKITGRASEYNILVYNESVENYRKNTINVKNGLLATKRGWRFLKDGKTEIAIALLERADKLEEDYRDAPLYLGYAYMQKVTESGKKNYFDMVVELNNDEKQQLLNRAKDRLLVAQKIDPLNPLTNKLLGIVYKSLDNDKESELWYARYEEVSK